MALGTYREIDISSGGASDPMPQVTLVEGDRNGRRVVFALTDGGAAVSATGLTARLLYNTRPDDPASVGGYTAMQAVSGAPTATFAAYVPTDALVPPSVALAVEVTDANGVICTRRIEAEVERGVLNGNAQPAKNALDAVTEATARANELLDGLDIEMGAVSTLAAGSPATASLTGDGLSKVLNLGIPRGEPGAAPDVSLSASVDGSTGAPSVAVTESGTAEAPAFSLAFSGLKGERGEKGEQGDAGQVATADTAGVVKPGDGLSVDADGTLSVTGSASGAGGAVIVEGSAISDNVTFAGELFDEGSAKYRMELHEGGFAHLMIAGISSGRYMSFDSGSEILTLAMGAIMEETGFLPAPNGAHDSAGTLAAWFSETMGLASCPVYARYLGSGEVDIRAGARIDASSESAITATLDVTWMLP